MAPGHDVGRQEVFFYALVVAARAGRVPLNNNGLAEELGPLYLFEIFFPNFGMNFGFVEYD